MSLTVKRDLPFALSIANKLKIKFKLNVDEMWTIWYMEELYVPQR